MATTDIRQFGTAAKLGTDRGDDDDPIVVDIAGRRVTLHSPGSGQLAYLAANIAGYKGTITQFGALINFVANSMSEEDADWFERALIDNEIDFEGDDALELCTYMIEEWSGERPTTPSSDSSSRRRQTGQSSTAATSERPAARRRSTSASPAS